MAGRYVEREIVNHSMLLHPHIIQFKEVTSLSMPPLNIQQAASSTEPEELPVCHDVCNSLLCLLMQVFLTPEYLAISMEYAKGGDMFQYVKTKGGLQVSIILRDMWSSTLPEI